MDFQNFQKEANLLKEIVNWIHFNDDKILAEKNLDDKKDLSLEGNELQNQISHLVLDSARGPVRMEMQLRYLLELTLEGSSINWKQ